MSAFVVDTNVPVVANGRSEQADPACVIACIDALREVREGGIIVLDDAMRILGEYLKSLSLSGQPGAGDFFLKWVWTVQADETRCVRVHLTDDDDRPGDFREFPDDPELTQFDRSDRKFVAVALACESKPAVLNAVDADWAENYPALKRAGLTIRFVCPQHVCPRQE